jgi:hypothetical protein
MSLIYVRSSTREHGYKLTCGPIMEDKPKARRASVVWNEPIFLHRLLDPCRFADDGPGRVSVSRLWNHGQEEQT